MRVRHDYSVCSWMGVDLVSDGVKPYKVNDRAINHAVELKHGKSIKVFNMDRISNSPFTDVRLFRSNIPCHSNSPSSGNSTAYPGRVNKKASPSRHGRSSKRNTNRCGNSRSSR
jgi:hypothetical protein